MTAVPDPLIALAKKHGATMRSGRVSFPNAEALQKFSEQWVEGAPERLWEERVAAVEDPTALPVTDAGGFYGWDWAYRVEAYARHFGLPLAEVFRRISAECGAHPPSMSLRFQKARDW